MVSRGYRGNARTLDRQRIGVADVLFFAATAVFAAGILVAERLIG